MWSGWLIFEAATRCREADTGGEQRYLPPWLLDEIVAAAHMALR